MSIWSILAFSTSLRWWFCSFCNIPNQYEISQNFRTCIFSCQASLSRNFLNRIFTMFFYDYYSEWVLARLLWASANARAGRKRVPEMSIFDTLPKSLPEARLPCRVGGECFAPITSNINFSRSRVKFNDAKHFSSASHWGGPSGKNSRTSRLRD